MIVFIYNFICYQMLSLLPSRVLRLMEFLGFSGDRVGETTYLQMQSSLRVESRWGGGGLVVDVCAGEKRKVER